MVSDKSRQARQQDPPSALDLVRLGRRDTLYTSEHGQDDMPSTTFTLRVDETIKKRLETLAKRTGRTRSYLAGEAISEYLDINEWQVAGIKHAIASLDRGEGVAHQEVKDWISSWDGDDERPAPKHRRA